MNEHFYSVSRAGNTDQSSLLYPIPARRSRYRCISKGQLHELIDLQEKAIESLNLLLMAAAARLVKPGETVEDVLVSITAEVSA
ncbi:hypothetical protein D3C86_1575490 [compost metagenome]